MCLKKGAILCQPYPPIEVFLDMGELKTSRPKYNFWIKNKPALSRVKAPISGLWYTTRRFHHICGKKQKKIVCLYRHSKNSFAKKRNTYVEARVSGQRSYYTLLFFFSSSPMYYPRSTLALPPSVAVAQIRLGHLAGTPRA